MQRSLHLLATRRFGTFWFASLLSNIGTWAQQVAQPWLLLTLGASPVLLGVDAFASGAPVLLLTLVGGALADRWDRRRVIGTFQSIQMLCPVAVVVLLLTGELRPWMVIALSFVIGVTDALSMPSFQTIVSTIVDRRDLPTGIALNSTQFNLSRILGPALAGLLMAGVGAVGAYGVSALSYLPFVAVALWVLPRASGVGHPVGDTPPHRLFEGVRAVVTERRLRLALALVFASGCLCSPLITFCPVLVKAVFGGGVGDFSLTVGAFGAGGLLGALGLLSIDPERDRRPIAVLGAAAFALAIVLAAIDPWAIALPALFFLAGAAMTTSNASVNAFLQSQAPAAIRGQTVALFMIATRGGVAAGNLLTGFSVTAWGARNALLVNGVLALIVQIGIGAMWLRRSAAPRDPGVSAT